jgi:hypothetical protein
VYKKNSTYERVGILISTVINIVFRTVDIYENGMFKPSEWLAYVNDSNQSNLSYIF